MLLDNDLPALNNLCLSLAEIRYQKGLKQEQGWTTGKMILMIFLVFKCYCTLVVSQNEHCQSSVTLPQCEAFYKQYNLPMQNSHKESHCCCKADIESSTPGYVVIWDEGEFQSCHWYLCLTEATAQRCSIKMVLLEISPENTFARVSSLVKVPQPVTLFKKQRLSRVLPCEFCKISKNTFLQRTTLVAVHFRIKLVSELRVNVKITPVTESAVFTTSCYLQFLKNMKYVRIALNDF